MGISSERYRKRKETRQRLEHLIRDSKRVILIHYSCESFYDRPEGASPRITSIAVRNLQSGLTSSFSIHQVAERQQVTHVEIENQYNNLEKTMLKEFYEYVEKHSDCMWLHWNMRDINYGFPALAHRFRVLKGKPVDIHESNLCDLARLLIKLYGPAYAGHPRLTKLMTLNSISDRDFLTGKEEADAFDSKDYVKLHQSTLRKVDVMGNIVGRLEAGSLKTNATWRDIHGTWLGYLTEVLREHWLVSIVGFAAAVASIISLILWLVSRG